MLDSTMYGAVGDESPECSQLLMAGLVTGRTSIYGDGVTLQWVTALSPLGQPVESRGDATCVRDKI